MIVKTFHCVDYGDAFAMRDRFHPQHGWHYLVLPHKTLTPEEWHDLVHKDNPCYAPPDHARILMGCSFLDEGQMEHVLHPNQMPSLVSLPHPVWEGNVKLQPQHVEEVHHLFCGFDHLFDEHSSHEAKKAAAAKADVREVIRRAALRHPALRLSMF